MECLLRKWLHALVGNKSFHDFVVVSMMCSGNGLSHALFTLKLILQLGARLGPHYLPAANQDSAQKNKYKCKCLLMLEVQFQLWPQAFADITHANWMINTTFKNPSCGSLPSRA